MESRELVRQIAASLDKHKAQNLKIIGVRDLTVIADYFVIAAGTSSTQVKALADYVEYELGQQGIKPRAGGGIFLLQLDIDRLRQRNRACVL